MNEQRERRVLFLLLFFLLALGLLMCYSTSQAIANRLTGDSNYFFYRHIISIVIGLFCMLFFYKIPIDFLSRFYKVLIFICIFLLFLVFIPGLGKTVGGSTRWISLAGFTIQSSELTKFSLLLYFSTFFSFKKR